MNTSQTLLGHTFSTTSLLEAALRPFYINHGLECPLIHDTCLPCDTSDPAEVPEDESKLVGSAKLIPPLLATAKGLVLDIGPGSGAQVRYFRRTPDLVRIYGAEPSTGLHDQLRHQAETHGLGDIYNVLGCHAAMDELAPALRAQGIDVAEQHSSRATRSTQKGIFDTIVCVRVLCSVPNQEKACADFYRLLRPGGSLIVVEHVVNPWLTAKGSVIARALQLFYQSLGWSFWMSNCSLQCDTMGSLKKAAQEDGGWEAVDVDWSFGWAPLCYISGRLVKREKV